MEAKIVNKGEVGKVTVLFDNSKNTFVGNVTALHANGKWYSLASKTFPKHTSQIDALENMRATSGWIVSGIKRFNAPINA